MPLAQDIPAKLTERFNAMGWVGMGCALVQGGTISGYSLGTADLARKIPVQEHSRFDIASVGKLFTTVAVLRLVETGRLTLDTALGDLLEDLPEPWHGVRIVHLLTHSSGIKNYTDMPDYWKEVQDDVPRDRILQYVRDYPLDFEPGTRWAYSNTGFYLLGLVMEAVSRSGYFDFVRELIEGCRPGLRIGPTGDTRPISTVVTGYHLARGVPTPVDYYSNRGTFSAGGFSAALPDFMEFENALFSGRILDRSSLTLITRSYEKPNGETLRSPDPDFGFEMAHGLFKFRKDGLTILAHRGETSGFSSCYKRILEKDIAVIIAVNTRDVSAVEAVADEVLEIALDRL
jgi:CubicO group peptidase (beta-lactamase class C family)